MGFDPGETMPPKSAAFLDELQSHFESFSRDPLDYAAFFAWRASCEKLLKRSASELLADEAYSLSFFSMLDTQLQRLPKHWGSEIVALRIRLGWLAEDLKGHTSPAAIKILELFRSMEKVLNRGFTEPGDESFLRVPEVVLPKSSAVAGKFSGRTNLTANEIKDLFKACKTQSAWLDLSYGLINSFYTVVQGRNPQEITDFLNGVRDILIPLHVKIGSNQIFMALLDTFPYLLFFAHRAPYDEKFIECSRLLGDILLHIMDHPLVTFKGKDCEPLDETIHYLFHTLFYSLEQGRLAAFMDLFKVSSELLNQSAKLDLKYFYTPIVSEMFYWIPAAYKDKLRSFLLDEVRKRISVKPDSPLRPLFELVNTGSGEDLDRFIVVGEFLKEVYKDGKVSEIERKTIRDLLTALQMKPLEYRRVLREVMREYRHDEIQGGIGTFDKNLLMLRLLKLALANQDIDIQEKNLLHTAARVLGIDRSSFATLLKRARAEALLPKEAHHLEKGFRRLGWAGVSKDLLKSLEWYKWNQMKLEGYQRTFEKFLGTVNYRPGDNQFVFKGEVEEYFSPLEGEVKITGFEEQQISGGQEEIGVIIFSPRRLLRKWFEIAAQVDYLLVDSTKTTFSVEFYLVNLMGSVLMTRNVPIQEPEVFSRIVKQNRGRYRLFIVEEETKKLVYWQKVASYLIEKKKIEPLLDALQAKNFTSIKIISQIGQKKDPDEVIYYHAMIENVLYLGSNQEEYLKMIDLCKRLIDDKFPDDFKLYYYLGCLYFEIGKSSEAYHWLSHSIKVKPDYKEALYLFCERKLMEDVYSPQALGYLKFIDLCFPKEGRLKDLYQRLEKKHEVALQPLMAKSRLMTNTLALRQ
ncbi:MAG: hypothetical protein H3C47_07720 [Candidatus Cloacimonetes bacterium]|nr:hypothetical protein [Candidatus Cloacimonadota bacterium]